MNGNYEFFLDTDLSKYAGNWVVIVNRKVVASGKDIKKMVLETRKKYPGKKPFIAKVPEPTAIIV